MAAHKKKLEANAAALKRGPKRKAIGEKFRQLEVASYIIELLQPGKRVQITRFVDPDAAKRYGYMVYVRCT